MKRLLFLTILSTIASGAAGCSQWRSRGAPCRPVCTPAPACGPTAVETYSTPGVFSTSPTVVLPQGVPAQTVPGPETYSPATTQ